MKFIVESAQSTISLGKKIGSHLQAGDVVALQGDLGAGKTTLAKGIAAALGVLENLTSPTFCLASEYAGKIPLYHFDAYRLQDEEDFLDLGAEEMIYGSGVCLIEWSEKVMNALPKSTIVIQIESEKIEEKNSCLQDRGGVKIESANAGGGSNQNCECEGGGQNQIESEKKTEQKSRRIVTIKNWRYEKIEGAFE